MVRHSAFSHSLLASVGESQVADSAQISYSRNQGRWGLFYCLNSMLLQPFEFFVFQQGTDAAHMAHPCNAPAWHLVYTSAVAHLFISFLSRCQRITIAILYKFTDDVVFTLSYVLGWHGVCSASGLRMNTVQPASYKQQRPLIKHDSIINTLQTISKLLSYKGT